MADEEVARLKLEIARLNRIITVLVEQHEIIKQNTGLRTNQKGNRKRPDEPFIHQEGNIGQGQGPLTNQRGNISIDNPVLSKQEGNRGLDNTSLLPQRGNRMQRNALFTDAELSSLTYSDVPIHLQSTLNITGMVKSAVWDVCHPQMHQSYVDNACAVIIHFHNGGAGDYPTLRRMTGLSNFGLAKFIRSLKRKNLIVRIGWQKFAPGAKGKEGLLEGWKSELNFPS